MKQVCQEASISYETLKFYCNQGLVPNVKRNKNNYRVFYEHDIAWIKGLICLKNCGMSIAEMREYLKMCLEGVASIPKRKEMLEGKRKELLVRIKLLQDSVEYIDWKQDFYDDVLSGKITYTSNLIKASSQGCDNK